MCRIRLPSPAPPAGWRKPRKAKGSELDLDQYAMENSSRAILWTKTRSDAPMRLPRPTLISGSKRIEGQPMAARAFGT
jgi:hypothetical protein